MKYNSLESVSVAFDGKTSPSWQASFQMLFFLAFVILFACSDIAAQTTERSRPEAWRNLSYGGRFMDRFLPMTNNGSPARTDVWGGANVLPRYVENGIEHPNWSMWCADIKFDSGKYHMFTVGWLESSPRGHATWPSSTLFHAVSDNMVGPFIIKDTIGPGHNSEAFKLKDGRWIVYVIDRYYIANSVNGPWQERHFDFQNRDRKIMDGLSNCTFAQREDGSYLMVNRGGGTWFSQTGESSYSQISERSAYPPIKGNFEDPVVWRDNVQYNLVVNDWLGRIAYYLRSKDGVVWRAESGEAYMPGIARHDDGTVEGWHKFERMRVLQDSFGRAIQAGFAVIDVEKKFDKGNDIHSSKFINIPLVKDRLLTILNKEKITAATKTIRVKITAESDFNPQKELDTASLRFGGSEEVNFGRGSNVLGTEKDGKDLVLIFRAQNSQIPEDDYAAKLVGKTKAGGLVIGYARLPGISFKEPILSARLPVVTAGLSGYKFDTEVQNFGQFASQAAILQISCVDKGQAVTIGTAKIHALQPFEKVNVQLSSDKLFEKGVVYDIAVSIEQDGISPVLLHAKVTPQP